MATGIPRVLALRPTHCLGTFLIPVLGGLGGCGPEALAPLTVELPSPPSARADLHPDLPIDQLVPPLDTACVLSVNPFHSAVDREGTVSTALHLSKDTPPFAQLQNADAVVVALTSSSPVVGHLSAQTGGVFIQGVVLPTVYLHDQLPPEQFVHWTGNTPLIVDGATRVSDRVVLSLTYRTTGLSSHALLRTTAFCDSVSPQPTEMDTSRLPVATLASLTNRQTPIALSPHEDFIDAIERPNDRRSTVEVLSVNVDRTRIAWNNGESWLVGWVASDAVSTRQALYLDSAALAAEPPSARGGFFEAVVCPHDVPLIAEVASRQVRVGAALRGTTIRLQRPPSVGPDVRARLLEIDLDADGLRLAPDARWLTSNAALSGCASIR